jgi:FMN phosphatase YigB (HAD superfamily)
LQQIKEPPERILHVAFGFKYDLAPAKQVGMRTCWLNRTGEPKPEGIEPDFVVATMEEVVRLVASE